MVRMYVHGTSVTCGAEKSSGANKKERARLGESLKVVAYKLKSFSTCDTSSPSSARTMFLSIGLWLIYYAER
jgi:hypothetical protein